MGRLKDMSLAGAVAFFSFYAIVLGGPLWLAWYSFLKKDGSRLRQSRRFLAVVGLSGTSLSAAGVLGLSVHAMLIGGLGFDNVDVFRGWAQPGILLALISPVLVLAAIGRSRVIGLISGFLVFSWWYLVANAF